MAQAIVYNRYGGPEVLEFVEIPTPEITAGKLLVRVEAAGVNLFDAISRGGTRGGSEITKPRRVGFDGAGLVEAVGEGVTGFSVGDRVAISGTLGTYATHLLVSPEKATVLPESVTSPEGAAIGIPAGTAYQSLKSLDVTSNDTVLIHAGTGSVGQAAIQFAVNWGAAIVATGSEQRHDELRALGATPVAYGPGLTDRVEEAAPNGVTVALDCIGTDEAIEVSLEVVPDRQRIATIVRGADAAEYGIRAFSGGSPVPLTDQETSWRAEAIPVTIDLIAQGLFTVNFGPSFPLADAASAHQLVESRSSSGKIILLP